MFVTISARHCTAPATVRERATQRLDRLRRIAPGMIGAEIDLWVERGVHRVDARIVLAGAPPIRASGMGMDFRSALDGALDRVRRQMTEHKARRRDRAAARVLVRV